MPLLWGFISVLKTNYLLPALDRNGNSLTHNLSILNISFILPTGCQVNTEMTNTSVIVSISVITAVCILLGITIFLAKGISII